MCDNFQKNLGIWYNLCLFDSYNFCIIEEGNWIIEKALEDSVSQNLWVSKLKFIFKLQHLETVYIGERPFR